MSLDTQYAQGGAVELLTRSGPDGAGHRGGRRAYAWVMVLLVLVPLQEIHPADPQAEYSRARSLFEAGYLARAQERAAASLDKFGDIDPEMAARFLLLEADSMVWRGLNENALRLLYDNRWRFFSTDERIHQLTLEGVALTRLQRFSEALRNLKQSEELCGTGTFPACGGVLRAEGILALEQERFDDAKERLLRALAFSRQYQDRMLETTILLNVGAVSLQRERYDEAVDWSQSAYQLATQSGEQDLAQAASGNLGWAYFKLGDRERALELFLEAEKLAAKLGDTLAELRWSETAGYVQMDSGRIASAMEAYLRALKLARQINSEGDISGILVDLAQASIVAGNSTEADTYANEARALAQQSGNRADQADTVAIQLQAAALRGDRGRAQALLREVEASPESATSMKWASEHALAKLYEQQGDTAAALEAYASALRTVEQARAEIQNEGSRLPFLSNAARIYDDYIHFLLQQGRTDEALAAADQSRAQTLAQGLGLAMNSSIPGLKIETRGTPKTSLRPAALRTGEIARKSGASILFYWLGEKESYLWAITASRTTLFRLPGQRDIAPLVERYRRALLEPEMAADATNADGMALYRMLVAPAAPLIAPGGNVIVVCDGRLSLLNFETLVVPADASGSRPHYWIDEANVVSAPSLYMLAAAQPARSKNRHLLLLGDAQSPNEDYPQLPMARAEMQKIERHFPPAEETVFAGQSANPGAYLHSPLQDYAYIHFVAHGVASRTDPLDSAIILSRAGAAEDSFKLHAREIIQHPLDARLVTISACYGSGTRSYAGEGLVGLSWAFLRAGAHNVIGALWEASDDSTPLLMDKLYAGLADGMSPSAALRAAKLSLLHSQGKFREPFYWATFQLYAGM